MAAFIGGRSDWLTRIIHEIRHEMKTEEPLRVRNAVSEAASPTQRTLPWKRTLPDRVFCFKICLIAP